MRNVRSWMRRASCLVFLVGGLVSSSLSAGEAGRPLVLQEMSWSDVRAYLSTNDMVIIPIGSTEQHGPHLPLGTDFFLALETAKRVSAETGVVVAPVVYAGYSVYHSGFPGTLSLKPETMEEVLYETSEMLTRYGFRRILFWNAHGGNRVVEAKVIHRINHHTPAIAVAIGIGSSFQRDLPESEDWFDQHGGVDETSMMLFFHPELVQMERAEKPRIRFTPEMREYLMRGRENPDLMEIFWSLLATPEKTGKGGASHQISSNGIWPFSDPKDATREHGEQIAKKMVANAVAFIEAWKKVKPKKDR